MTGKFLTASAALVLIATAASAHHGWSTYDATKVMTVQAPILMAKYENPHGEIQMEHQGQRWTVTLAPPSRMSARGLSQQDLAVGKTVTAEGYPSRVNEREMRAERVTVDGRKIELR